MQKAFKYRFYPTAEQESLLRRTMGCVRLVYNKALDARTSGWYERQERIGFVETSSMLTNWKKQEDLEFLNEVSSVPLQQGLRNLQKAFTNFWAGRARARLLPFSLMLPPQDFYQSFTPDQRHQFFCRRQYHGVAFAEDALG